MTQKRPSHAGSSAPHVLREYALIADGERGALIGPQGDIAWMCAPRWDSDAVFSTLLGGQGSYAITPAGRFVWGGYYEDHDDLADVGEDADWMLGECQCRMRASGLWPGSAIKGDQDSSSSSGDQAVRESVPYNSFESRSRSRRGAVVLPVQLCEGGEHLDVATKLHQHHDDVAKWVTATHHGTNVGVTLAAADRCSRR